MEYKRTIRFQYYQILCKEKDKNDKWSDYKTFNLVDWIVKMNKKSNVQKPIKFNSTLASIDQMGYDKSSDLWGIRFMKLRDTNIPTKVKENVGSQAIKLEDDEYIGEDVTMLYEKKSSLAMIQANRFSLGISKLEEFINYTNEDENVRVYIEPIIVSDNIDRLKKCNYKNIDISFANLGDWTDDKKGSSLASLISPIKKAGGYAGHIRIGLGYVKNDYLNKIESNKIVNEILSNKRFIRSAKVRVSDDDNTDVEIVDLFDEIYHDFIDFTLLSKTALEYREAITGMIYYFNKRKSDLYSSIGYSNGED